MQLHAWQRGQIVPGAVGHQMQLGVRTAGQVERQRVVGAVHAAQRGEVAGDQQPQLLRRFAKPGIWP